MNKEDFEIGKKIFSKEVIYIPGIGVELEVLKLTDSEKLIYKKDLLIEENQKVLIAVGELISRKNLEVIIDVLYSLKNENIKLLVCGKGKLENYLKNKVEDLGLENKIVFLGFRDDIYKIYQLSDICVFPSKQEGLPVALLEAMVNGLPCIASNIRGNEDLIDNNKGGILFSGTEELLLALETLLNDNLLGTHIQG